MNVARRRAYLARLKLKCLKRIKIAVEALNGDTTTETS